MQLKFIENGTRLDVQVATDGSRAYTEKNLFGTFVDSKTDLLFLLDCQELLARERTPQEGDFMRFTFFRGAESFTFEGKLISILDDFGRKLLLVNAVSPIEKSSRRKAQRIQISLPVTLYRPSFTQNDIPGEFSSNLTAFDISSTGICLLSNQKLDLLDGDDFVVELHVPNSIPYLFPAKHIRTGNCPQFVQFNYDHAFSFDDDGNIRKIYNLTLKLFELKLQNKL